MSLIAGIKNSVEHLMLRRADKKLTQADIALIDNYMIRPFPGFPGQKPDVTVGFGSGAVSGGVAHWMAQKAAEGEVADVVCFVGDVRIAGCVFAGSLIPMQTAAGIAPPSKTDREAPHMARVYCETYHKLTGRDAKKDFTVVYENPSAGEKGSTNTQENIAAFAELMATLTQVKTAPKIIGVAALPNAIRRVMGTWRHERAEAEALMPMSCWVPSADITEAGWKNDPVSRVSAWLELKKILSPTDEKPGPYIGKYCDEVFPNIEYLRTQRALAARAEASTLG